MCSLGSTSQLSWKCLALKDFPRKKVVNATDVRTPRRVTKPPNIQCYNTGSELICRIRSVVDPHVYTVYALSPKDWVDDVWQSSTNLLVISDSSPAGNQADEIAKVGDYLMEGTGKVLLIVNSEGCHSPAPGSQTIATSLDAPQDFTLQRDDWGWKIRGNCLCLTNARDDPVMVVVKLEHLEVFPERLASALDLLGLEPVGNARDRAPSPTPLLAYKSVDSTDEKFDAIKKVFEQAHDREVCVISKSNLPADGFSWGDYFNRLETTRIGRYPVWADVLTSSYTICQGILSKLPKQSGLMLASSVQTAGVGRRSNQWISPRGMAAFTLHVDLPLSDTPRCCEFSRLLCWLQHICSLAVAMALRQLIAESVGIDWRQSGQSGRTEQDILATLELPSPEIRVKWPNDVYVVDGGSNTYTKVSGTLTSASLSKPDEARCLIGNPLLFSEDCSLLSIETGEEVPVHFTFRGQRVKVCEGQFRTECTIVGVDDFGYLRAISNEDKNIVLHPNGNSLDMLAGCVISRNSQTAK
ncbi:unnamed protein product [Mesocestoides corti]|uniref:BPL/LPL catalytic domain-containing protein n=1 Tax=Mesocestoides corti TaxID=53468 RepID=A0A0R3UJR8_MESCO|nr:unnamed protein product [Mesocestoides corti]